MDMQGKLFVSSSTLIVDKGAKIIASAMPKSGIKELDISMLESIAYIKELVRRWNSQPELLEVLLRVNKWLVQNTAAANRPAILDKAILDVIATAETTG